MTITNKQTYNITFSINRAHLLFMCVTLYSLLKNNQQYNFNIYVLHNNCLNDKEIKDITNKHPLNQYNNFKIHLVDCSHLEVLKDKNFISDNREGMKWPKEILFKLFLPDLLANVDKILHLDTDVMIREDISKLFEIENNMLFKGNPQASMAKKEWLNAGILLYNLKLARELKTVEKIINYLSYKTTTEEYLINKIFTNQRIFFKDKIILHLDPLEKDKLHNFNNIVAIHYLRYKPYVLNSGYFTKKLFFEYHEFLRLFIKNKIRYEILVYSSFIFNIYCSWKRRYIHWMKKYFNKKLENKTTFFTDKLYKYSIIGKK